MAGGGEIGRASGSYVKSLMFNPQQRASFSALARQSAGLVGFTRTRLLVRSGPTDDEQAGGFVLLVVVGVLLLLALGSFFSGNGWVLGWGVAVVLAGLAWGGRRLQRHHHERRQAPPSLVFDLPQQSFYVLAPPLVGEAAARYDCYPAHRLIDSRALVLAPREEHSDAVVELDFGTGWVRVVQVSSELLATQIAQELLRCKAY